ncbi:MAG: tellurite resistance TerB family protein [Pseudomonadota bacterium]
MTQGFDMRSMLDSLISGGTDLARRGEDLAAGQLGVGSDASSRSDMRKGMLGGAVGAGVLSLLLGTETGRRIGGTGLAVGGLAALGKIAYDMYQQHQAGAAPAPLAAPVDQLEGEAADGRARMLLTAMIAAAKADGHVDDAERAAIQEKLEPLGPDATGFLFEELAKPLDPQAIAAMAGDPQERAEVYTISAYLCGTPNAEERAYLDRLGAALGLDATVRQGIEARLQSA